jgi:threonyl-tRNA synthetase
VQEVVAELRAKGFRVESDLRNEKITYKIREHSLQKLPYLLVVGDKEKEAGKVAVRVRGGQDLGQMSITELAERWQHELESRGAEA